MKFFLPLTYKIHILIEKDVLLILNDAMRNTF